MTTEMIKQLMAAGLNKQQATSVTAETLVNLFMEDDGKLLMKEAQRQVLEMQSIVQALKSEYNDLMQEMSRVSDTILSITEAQNEHGIISDEKAKNVVALYAALLSMNEKAGADPADSVKSAGYVVYAYLGGQAKREVTYSQD